MTTGEVAKMLKVSRDKIQRLVKKYILPARPKVRRFDGKFELTDFDVDILKGKLYD